MRASTTRTQGDCRDRASRLITGTSGFIAKHCALELLEHGYAVRGTVRKVAKAEETRATLAKHCAASRLGFVEADLLADPGWADAMKGIAGVLHVASPFPLGEPKDPDELLRPAVDGTLRVLRVAMTAGVPRVVQTFSMAAVRGGRHDNRQQPHRRRLDRRIGSCGVRPRGSESVRESPAR